MRMCMLILFMSMCMCMRTLICPLFPWACARACLACTYTCHGMGMSAMNMPQFYIRVNMFRFDLPRSYSMQLPPNRHGVPTFQVAVNFLSRFSVQLTPDRAFWKLFGLLNSALIT